MEQGTIQLADLTAENTKVVGLNGQPAGHCGYSLPIIRNLASGLYCAVSVSRKPCLLWSDNEEIQEMAKLNRLTLLKVPIRLPKSWDGKDKKQPVVAWFSKLSRTMMKTFPESAVYEGSEFSLFLICDILEIVDKLLTEIATTAQVAFDDQLAVKDRKWELLEDTSKVALNASGEAGARYWMYVRRAIPLYFSPKAKPELAYQLFRGAVEPTYPGTTWDNFFECMRILHERGEYFRRIAHAETAP